MSEKVLNFVLRVNKVFPEIPPDALLAIWDKVDQEPSVEDPIPTEIKDPAPTCKHKFLKGRNANT